MMRSVVFILAFLTSVSRSYSQKSDSLDFKIGQMVMIGIPKAELDSLVLDEVKKGKVGALIFFEKNVPNRPNAFASLKKLTWSYQKAAPMPLLICIDQEGGKVNRLKEKYGFTRSITAASIGKYGSLDSVRFYAEATAATLAGLGFNVNFAPSVDLAINKENTVIAKPERSYSFSEDTVVMMAREVITQHRKFGIITSLKHFPGHGSSAGDTHYGVTDVTNTWSERELKPFKTLIDEGYADGVMTSHIVNKNLDKNGLPGTLSKDILDGILRKRIGYQGVVFSDDMQMKAISDNYGLEETIRLAINAGVDVMCFSNNIQGSEQRTVDKVHGIIKQLVRNGQITEQRINESFQRIKKLKNGLNKFDASTAKTEAARLQQEVVKLQSELAQAKTTTTATPETKKSKRKKRAKTNS